jgi:hypothetical protein
MRNVVGFDTPSKRKATEEMSNQQENNQQESLVNAKVNNERLKAETIQRINQLGSIICSDEFQTYAPQQRQVILMDFAYFSKVADSVL